MPKTYTGKSDKTLSRHRKKKEVLESKGFYGIFEYLEMKANARENATVDQPLAGDPTPIEASDQQTEQASPDTIADQQVDPGAAADQQADPGSTADRPADPDQQASLDDSDRMQRSSVAMREEEESNGSDESRSQSAWIDLEDEEGSDADPEDRSDRTLRSVLENLRKQRDLLDPSPPSSDDNALDLNEIKISCNLCARHLIRNRRINPSIPFFGLALWP
jgi:hypothetical protein